MRPLFLPLLLFQLLPLHAQRLDPDQNPYWTRYTFVEDSSALVPLMGAYRVYYIQSGMWWNMSTPGYPIRDLPEVGMRLHPLFTKGRPAFQATPARGLDYPEVRLVVVRERDTMVVELSIYCAQLHYDAIDRCARTDCKRRPPVVLPFRPGRYVANGAAFGPDGAATADPRTTELTRQFDALWSAAMSEERVVPQLNTDTCKQEIVLPPPVEMNRTPMRDAWVLRSPYCGTHFVHFPLKGTRTTYIIKFNPYRPNEVRDPITLDTSARDDVNYWLDVTDWPIGDHPVRLLADGVEESFTLKLR